MRAPQVARKTPDAARAAARRPAPVAEARPAERRHADRQAALDESPRVQRAASTPTIQRQFVIDGKPIPDGPAAWIFAATAMTEKLKGREGFSDKLMKTIAGGFKGMAETRDITQDDLERVYVAAEKIVWAEVHENARALEECRAIASSSENQEALKRVLLAKSSDLQLVFRGMTAGQALAVLREKTLGGAERAKVPREPPSEEEAIVQTGENRKDAGRGLLEEWSLGELAGFATGGVLLAALAPTSGVRLPLGGRRASANAA